METNNVGAALIPVSHSDSSNLKERDIAEIYNVIGRRIEPRNAAKSSLIISLNDHDNESREKEDDQDSVIIEEVENKPIELNEDSDEETERNSDQRTGTFLGATNNSGEKTEFVIVNEANMSTVQIADETNRYATEDIQIKDELAESVTADLNTNDVLENDPMDLLELNNRSDSASSPRSHEDTDDYGDDVSSIGSSSVQTGTSSSVNVQEWVKDYPWLLYEEGDEPFGYCLYCDTKVNTKSQRSVKQHGLSLYHKERCDNYLAFREEEEKNGLSMKLVEIKEEFGTDSRVEALKLKRKSQSVALNNFNWRRWLEDYPWLERDSVEGTIGFCKYCLLHVNVEFSYLRDRHQEGAKHKDAEKHYDGNNETRDQSKTSRVNDEKYKESTTDNIYSKSQRWIEFVEKEPAMVRCKICRTKMFKNNFLRHLRTNLHEHNEKMYLQNQKSIREKDLVEEPTKNQQYWKLYTKRHPWLVSDPADSSFAYCKYCEKRVIYGTSAAKRATHENSSHHKQSESLFKNRSHKVHPDRKLDENNKVQEHEHNDIEDVVERNNEEDEDEIEDENTDGDEGGNEEENEDEEGNEEIEGDNEDDCEHEDEDIEHDNGDNKGDDDEEEQQVDKEEEESQQEKESHDDNESKKRVYKLTDEWINQYSWCKRYGKDPTNFIYCIYCKIPLSVSYSRSKHQSTSFHISAEKEFLDKQSKKQKKQSNENFSSFEWAVPLKNNLSSYSCRYCRVRISKNYSKKQHEASKIHQINESIYKNNRRKAVRGDGTSTNHNNNNSQQLSNDSTKKYQSFSKVIVKSPSTVTLIKQLQKKFPWLSYKRSELRSNYGHCKLCNSSLYIRSLKHALRHVRSGRHISVIKAKKMQKVEKDEEVDDNETSGKMIKKGSKEELQKSSAANCDSSQNQTKQSIKTVESETKPYESQRAHSYKSTITEMRKRFSWIEKSDRPNYAFCRFCDCNIPLKVLFLRNHSNSRKHRHSVVNYYSTDGKKVAREVDRPNKADLNGNDSKVGDADDDVILIEDPNEEILISEQDDNWTVKSETMDEHEELDYLLQRSFNNTLQQSAVQSKMPRNGNTVDEPPPKRMKRPQSFRRLKDSNASLIASLLTTPLTLASCLGPLIQQQIQHHVNIPQISQIRTNESATDTLGEPKISTATVTVSGNTYDLFFKSVSETMKKLPADLATEGKLRVMQVICDLELQALKRQQSAANESSSSNVSSCLSYQAQSTSSAQPGCGSSVLNDINSEQNINNTETIITQLNMGTDMSPTSSTNLSASKVTNQCVVEKPVNPSVTSPIIGVMDKNGLQTLQLKTSIAKHIPRNATATTITTVANSGIRCIPFKNLSQPATPDTSSNTKITRIQVPINVTAQTPNQSANSLTSKNLINFRNIQITKRIATPTTTSAAHCEQQNPVQPALTMASKNSQIPFIKNFQPQLQRWGCTVNGATSQLTPISPAVNQLQQLPPQQSSTPVSRK